MATGLGSPIGAALATKLCNEADAVSVTNPGSQQTVFDGRATLQIVASDNQHHVLSYTAVGLPSGLAISTTTGQITGTATKTGPYSVTVTATDGPASGSTTFSWTVPTGGSACTPANPNLLVNPTFASGRTGWVASPNVIAASAGSEAGYDKGSDFAWLDGYSTPHTDTLSQTVTLPLGCTYTLTYYQSIDTTEANSSSAVDTLTMQVLASNGTTPLYTTTVSNLNAPAPGPAPSYSGVSIPLTLSIAGQQTITLKFTGAETNAGGGTTDFLLDDLALTVTPAS